MIVFAGIVPHPPIIVPGIEDAENTKVQKTIESYQKFAKELALSEPDTIIVISPHMIHYPHLFNVCGMSDLFGSFHDFGLEDFEWHGHSDLELAEEIVDKLEDEDLPAILYDNGEGEYEIDHGVMVPNYFFQQELDYSYKIIPIGYSSGSRSEQYALGQVVSEVCEKKRSERIAIIASGDLSHRLIGEGSHAAAKFDKELIDLIEKGDEYSIVNMEDDLVDNAGECGYKSILVLLGAISGRDYKPEVYSYEGPFGVGYAVVNMGLK